VNFSAFSVTENWLRVKGNGGLGAKPQEAEGFSFVQIVILTRKVKHGAAISEGL